MKPRFLIIACCLSFFSCKKDSNSDQSSNTQILTNAEWKYDSGGLSDANGNIIADITTIANVPSCLLDNSVRFNSDGTGTVSENANVCPSAPATSPINWSFASNETVLNLSGGAIAGIGGSFQIKELSTTKLSLLKDTTLMGLSGKVILNLKH